MMQFKRRLPLAGLAAASLLLCACEVAQPGSVSGARAAPGATAGGTLVVGITEPGSLDPANSYEPAGNQIMSAVCEPLLQLDPLTGQPVHGIATFWVVTQSGTAVTIQLRSGVRLQSGGTVTAADLVSELSRVANVNTASYVADVLAPVAGYQQLHGLIGTNSAQKLKQLAGVQQLSSDALTISLSTPDAAFLDSLADLITAPVNLAHPANLTSRPECAGPYEFTAPWQPGQRVIMLRRFPGYYGANQAFPRGGVGYPAQIKFEIFPNMRAEVAAFQAGGLDTAQVPDQLVNGPAPTGSSVIAAPNGYVEYVGLPNSGLSVFASTAVHQALSEALNRVLVDRQTYQGGSLPATGFVPPTAGSFYTGDFCGPTTPALPALALARETLARAGVSLAGRSLTFTYNNQFQNAALAESIARQWTVDFGLRVKLVPMGWTAYLATATSLTGFGGAYLESWQAQSPGPDGYLYPLFDSSQVGTNNFAHYVNVDFDRALESQARQATSLQDQTYDYRRAERMLCRQLPLIPLVFRQWHYLVRTSAVGSALRSFTDLPNGFLDLPEIYLKRG